MNKYFQRRETLYNVTLEKAKKQLATEYVRCFKQTKVKLQSLLYEIEAAKGDGTLLVSDLYRFNRYYDLLNSLNSSLRQMGEKELAINNKALTSMYLSNAKMVGKEVGIFNTNISEMAVTRAINTAWCPDGRVWVDRLWDNKALLQQRLTEGLVNQIAAGVPKDKLVEQLQKDFNAAFYEADRLVRTELSYVQNKSTLDAYKSAGIEYYEVLSSQADDECIDEDGRIVRIDEAEVGENLPPFHPNCRCSILAVID